MTCKISRRDVLTLAAPAASLAVAGGAILAADSEDPVVRLCREYEAARQALRQAGKQMIDAEARCGAALGVPFVAVPFMPLLSDGGAYVVSTFGAIDDAVRCLPAEERARWWARLRADLDAEYRKQDDILREAGYHAAVAQYDAARQRVDDTMKQMCDTPARGNAGAGAKLRIALAGASGWPKDLIRSALADLEG